MKKGCQSIFDASGTILFQGEWDPVALYKVLTGSDEQFWRGKSVLDIGANTCGLSIEIARRGGDVLALEPDPYCNTYSLSSPIVDRIVKEEGLKLLVKKLGLFDAQQFKGFDVVLCLGLLYHFRYPQLVLDYLSTLEMDWLFLSTQVHPGTSLFMFNRVDPSIPFPKNFFNDEIVLSGWHPTRSLLVKLLQSSGFADIESLTDEPYTYPKKQSGLTNSAYFKCRRVGIVDPGSAMVQFYPR